MNKLILPPDAENNNNSTTKEVDNREEFSSLLKKIEHLKIPNNDDFQEHENTLQLLLNYASIHFESPKYSQLMQSMLLILVNYSNKTVLVPCLIKTDYPSVLLTWLNLISNRELSRDADRLVGVIYNISRHENGIQVLNSLDTTNKLKEFQKHHQNSDINILCMMTMALLSTPEQIKNDRRRMNNILDQLLEIIVNASKQSIDYICRGWHISEPLIVLVRLICYDRTLDYVLQHAQVEIDTSSTVKFLIDTLLDFYKNVHEDNPFKLSTCTALCNILWSVSLRPQYKEELQESKELKILLEKIAIEKVVINPTQYVPTYIENIQKATDGILCNINNDNQGTISNITENERHKPIDDATIPSKMIDNKPLIMISYAHGDNNVCSQLYDELNKYNRQFDIWIDWKNSKTGYLWGKIADGIADATIILCLLSNKYYESKSCQQEFVYAHDHLKKPIIPIFILNDKPPGWLAIHTCIMKYVRFRNVNQLEQEKLKDLVEMIEENLFGTNPKIDQGSQPPTSLPVHHEILPNQQTLCDMKGDEKINSSTGTDLSRKAVEQWDKNDVKQWFQEKNISMDIWKLYQFENGGELLSYASSLSNDEKIETQQQIYSDEFAEMNKGKRLLPHQFITFAYVLRKLNCEQVANGTKQTTNFPSKQQSVGSNKSQTCEIS
ncbi:unnamed protein product [Adineta steineri]|uniref:TIR domain-containing protein n=1 Tax=Adineta steineri TaxID=433720 RepID=A0A814VN55_9BILA|nr:unnamed protein product [Adineta steineri]CAF1191196.1 unnamed protein product [Adineta steineri]